MAGLRVRRSRAAAAGSVALTLVLALAACTAAPSGEPTSRPTATPSGTATPPPEPDPVLIPTGDAEANLPYFDLVNRRLLETVATPNGQQLVENLVAAGFSKADMEVTPDTTVGSEAAATIQFSVRANGTCLVGQTGAAGYNAVAEPMLGTGLCLVGKTRAIDF
jgi:hypothetical protein